MRTGLWRDLGLTMFGAGFTAFIMGIALDGSQRKRAELEARVETVSTSCDELLDAQAQMCVQWVVQVGEACDLLEEETTAEPFPL